MKHLIFATIVFLAAGSLATAQNMGTAYEFIKKSYKQIPLHGNLPEYDTTISLERGINTGKLEQNAAAIFEKFDNKIINADEHVYSGNSSYSYSTVKKEDIEHLYIVNYTLKVHVKKGHYKVSLHSFTISNQDRLINFRESIKSADKNNGICNQFLAYFHKSNKDEITKICKAISNGEIITNATASR